MNEGAASELLLSRCEHDDELAEAVDCLMTHLTRKRTEILNDLLAIRGFLLTSNP